LLIAGEYKLKTLTIATPFYNEEDSLNNYFETLKKIYVLINKKVYLKFLFIDDGSTDATLKKLQEFKIKNSNYRIKIFSHSKNFGYGRTLKNSIKFCNTKYLITYDSDCTYDYKIINYLIDQIVKNKNDIINVSYKLAQKNIKINIFRKFLSWGSSFIYSFFFLEIRSYNVKVFTCSFRIYKLSKIKSIKLNSDDFNCCAELLIKAMINKLNIVEIPGENLGRKFGYSKMKIIKNIFNTLKTIFLIKIN
jgi:glycosyltransferase involved in cell wall biosynthesis